jgi:hypothetical protein
MTFSKAVNEKERKEIALQTAIEVLKAQPQLLPSINDGKQVAAIITDMADAFLTYMITTSPQKQE